jgi:nicotinamide riboside kinase
MAKAGHAMQRSQLIPTQPPKPATVVAILGAESTGKTALSSALVTALQAKGQRAAMVPELLRRFCDAHGRTPRQEEQAGIAQSQTDAIAQAALDNDWVIADTTALMTAVYSDIVFGDTALYAPALAAHGLVDLTLVTALDLPWVADGLQRDGPHVRAPVDGLIRQQLLAASLPFNVIHGQGAARLEHALAAISLYAQHENTPPDNSGKPTRWRWLCERCDDGDCEQHSMAVHLNT